MRVAESQIKRFDKGACARTQLAESNPELVVVTSFLLESVRRGLDPQGIALEAFMEPLLVQAEAFLKRLNDLPPEFSHLSDGDILGGLFRWALAECKAGRRVDNRAVDFAFGVLLKGALN